MKLSSGKVSWLGIPVSVKRVVRIEYLVILKAIWLPFLLFSSLHIDTCLLFLIWALFVRCIELGDLGMELWFDLGFGLVYYSHRRWALVYRFGWTWLPSTYCFHLFKFILTSILYKQRPYFWVFEYILVCQLEIRVVRSLWSVFLSGVSHRVHIKWISSLRYEIIVIIILVQIHFLFSKYLGCFLWFILSFNRQLWQFLILNWFHNLVIADRYFRVELVIFS